MLVFVKVVSAAAKRESSFPTALGIRMVNFTHLAKQPCSILDHEKCVIKWWFKL